MDYQYMVGLGWWPLLDEGLAKARELDPDVKIYDIREKYGSCRVDLIASDGADPLAIEAICDDIERRSETICEKCGAPGRLGAYDGRWVKCLCPACARADIEAWKDYIRKKEGLPENTRIKILEDDTIDEMVIAARQFMEEHYGSQSNV